LHSLDDLKQHTRLPVLGAIPKMLLSNSTQSGLSLPFRGASTPSIWQVINWLPFRESIDLVCKNIEMQESATFLKSLAVTSILPDAGKSTVALGLAISAARLHKRVLLIDANFRDSSVHTQLNLPNDLGLSTLLTAEVKIPAEKLIQTLASNPNLAVLTAGPTPTDPAQLLSSRRMVKLIGELEADYDLVVIDAPPLLGIVDTMLVASVCSGVVLVERLGSINRQHLTQAATMLGQLNVVGLIPNGVHYSPDRYAPNSQAMSLQPSFKRH
ncbi:CpsD/CapB family tyrosine-protein kinase, partial [Chamaesiphon sp. VAR_69_metabat_338]|uniref:CpsD/CapB family tyrosine-protein kinase n=1 Tax=Chamaesiphon sp. VAR_69_metabat_338 TaxID=2964704 RepID=UPI00286DF34A